MSIELETLALAKKYTDEHDSGSINTMTRAEFLALNPKPTTGFIGIVEPNKWSIKTLYDMSKYIEVESLLTNSSSTSILTEGIMENWDESTSWNNLFIAQGSILQDDYIRLGRMPSNSPYVSYDLGEENHSCTIYGLVRQHIVESGNITLMHTTYSNSGGNAPNFFSKDGTLYTSVYAGDKSTGLSASVWHLLTMVINVEDKKVTHYVDGVSYGDTQFNNSGRYIYFSHGVTPAYEDIRYVGIVDGIESESTVIANQNNIMNYFNM